MVPDVPELDPPELDSPELELPDPEPPELLDPELPELDPLDDDDDEEDDDDVVTVTVFVVFTLWLEESVAVIVTVPAERAVSLPTDVMVATTGLEVEKLHVLSGVLEMLYVDCLPLVTLVAPEIDAS